MARIQETAYPQLKSHYTAKELAEVFTPNDEEILCMENTTRQGSHSTQLCFVALLKAYQCIGRPIFFEQLPGIVLNHIANSLNIRIRLKNLTYSRSTRQRHIETIRQYLCMNIDDQAHRACMKKAALAAAETKENVADIINDMIDYLIKERYELPTYKSLLRLARAVRKWVNHRYYDTITSQLSDEIKAFIDALFDVPREKNSAWWQLKQEAKTPSAKSIQTFIQHLTELLALRKQIPFELSSIPPVRLEGFTSEAIAIDAADMKKLKPNHRYALATILIGMKAATAIDDLCTTLVLWVRKFHTQAKEALDYYRKAHANEVDQLIAVLYQLSVSVKDSKNNKERLHALNNHLTQSPDAIIEQCEKHMAYANDNYYAFMLKPYQNKRRILLSLVDHLDIQSTTQDPALKDALSFMKQHAKTTKQWLDLTHESESGTTVTLNIDWLSERWFKMVTGKSTRVTITQIHRHYFELALLDELADALNSGDAYVNNGYAFDDPNKQLISWEAFNNSVEGYCGLVKLSCDPSVFIDELQKTFRAIAERVDQRCPDNHALSIDNGLPTLKKSPQKEHPAEAKAISEKIADRMIQTNIVDVILDVEKWLSLSSHCKPLSGFEAKTQEHDLRFVATAFAYGCNIGPTEASRCLQKFSRKQIAWLFNHHLSEKKLDDINTLVINKYNQFDMPKSWGTGDSLSVDGTYWDMYKKNLLAAHHIRYGNFGGLGYYHISDKYIALYGNFISCGVHESHYLFDGMTENDSDIQPDKVHGDTGAQTEVTFAFGFLLAISLMPRIRNFKHLRYYKPAKTDVFEHLDDVFCDQVIDWDFIKLYYHDMLRAVMSVHAGKVKPSTILRRLGSKSRKNKLYFAFRELGRVIRTMFLLNYIDDAALRQMIHAGTCKSEEFNQFISWVRFGDGGIVGDNLRFNQQKIIKFGHLVANMLILHVTANMTKVVNTLKKEGLAISDNVLAAYCPYRTEHINRRGIFPLNLNAETVELEYALIEDAITS